MLAKVSVDMCYRMCTMTAVAQIRVSEEAAAELRRRADDEDRSIVAIVDRLLAQTRTEPERAAS